MNRFCPVCGRVVSRDEITMHGTCTRCHAGKETVLPLPREEFYLLVCPSCFKFKEVQGNEKTWNLPSRRTFMDVWIQAIYYYIVSRIEGHENHDFFFDFTKIPDPIDAGRKNVVHYTLTARPRDDGSAGPSLSRELGFLYSVVTCDDCALKRVGYHNSVVQVRAGSKRALATAHVDAVVEEITRFSAGHEYHGLPAIASIEHVAGGTDVKLLSKKFGSVVVHHLKKTTCIEVKESFKIIKPDKETGGNLKRMFYGVRLYPFVPGDVVTSEKTRDPSMIVKVSPEMVRLVSLKNGHEEHCKPQDIKEDAVIFMAGERELLSFEIIAVDHADRSATMMRADTFEEASVSLDPWHEGEVEGDMVSGFLHEGSLLLVPSSRVHLLGPRVHPGDE